MAETRTKEQQGKTDGGPTGAQLAKIAALTEQLGIEQPDVATQEDATKLLEELTRLADESAEPTGDAAEPGAGDGAKDDAPTGKGATPQDDDGLSPEQAQQLFDRAMRDFAAALCIVFGVEELESSQTPGIAGFVLPGFTEMKPHSDFTRCTTCNGYGDVLTGSMKAGDEKKPCPDPRCKGRGFWQKAGAPEPVQPTYVPMPDATANGAGEWGEAPKWMGDPNLTAPVTP